MVLGGGGHECIGGGDVGDDEVSFRFDDDYHRVIGANSIYTINK